MKQESNTISNSPTSNEGSPTPAVPRRFLRHLRLFTDLDLRLYLTLLNLAQAGDRVETSLSQLASQLHLTTQQVKRSLFRLVAFGIVKAPALHRDDNRRLVEFLPDTPATGFTSQSMSASPEKIADALEDRGNLSTYEYLCQTLSTDIIRRALNETLSVPPEKIRKSRTALFFYLLRRYARPQE